MVLPTVRQVDRTPVSLPHANAGEITARAGRTRELEAGIVPSMRTVGDACGNAMGESFFATLECELIDPEHLSTRD